MITINDIPAKYRFILEMYCALGNYLLNINTMLDDPTWRMNNINSRETFFHFMQGSFLWDKSNEGGEYWLWIARQEESKLILKK